MIIFLCLLCSIKAYSVSLEGYITDSLNRHAIEAVSVLVYDSTEHFCKGTITNSLGYYQITGLSLGHYTIKTRMLGYVHKAKEIDILNKDRTVLSFRLQEKSYELASVEVVFEPFLHYEEDDNLTINLEQLENIERMSVADVIETIPGVYFDIEGKLNFAGYDNYTQLIDGKKVGSSYGAMTQDGRQMYLQLKQIPAKYIKKIELFPEPRGRYGFYTPIMNIIPINDVRTHYDGKLGTGYKNKYDTYAAVSTYKGKLMLRPRVYTFCISDYKTQDTWRNVKNDSLRSYYRSLDYANKNTGLGGGMKLHYEFSDKERVIADISYDKNTSEVNNLWNYKYKSSEAFGLIDDRNIETEKWKLDATYSKLMDVGIKQSLHLSADAQFSKNNNSGDENTLVNSLDTKEEKNNTVSRSNAYGGTAKAVYYNRLWPVSLLLTTQLKSNYENAFSWRKLWNEGEQQWDELSPYSNDKSYLTLDPSLDLRLNYRFSKDNKKAKTKDRHSINAQISGNYFYEKIMNNALDSITYSKRFYSDWRLRYNAHLGQYHGLKFSYVGSRRYPTFSQRYASPIYLDDNNVRKSNPTLKPQQGHKINLHYGWNFSHGRVVVPGRKALKSVPKVGFELSMAYSLVQDKITSDYYYEDSVLIYSYTNAPAYQSGDLGLKFRWKIADRFHYNSSLNYLLYEYDKFETAFSLSNYIKHHLKNDISFSLKHQFYSDRQEYSYATKAYHTLSAELSALLFNSTTQVVLDIHNVLTSLGRENVSKNSLYNEININYLESPVIEFKVYFMIFKFYN